MHADELFLQEAIQLAVDGVRLQSGGPFGSVVVRGDQVIGRGYNLVTSTNDPTAHAEIVAIREACRHVGAFHLAGCTVYASCEPCPMCLAAIYWAHVDRIVYASTRHDAALAGFSDERIWRELLLPLESRTIELNRITLADANRPFDEWQHHASKIMY